MVCYAIKILVTIEKVWSKLDFGPGFDSTSPHNISKLNFLESFAKKLVRSLK